jgi:hypothetical protein
MSLPKEFLTHILPSEGWHAAFVSTPRLIFGSVLWRLLLTTFFVWMRADRLFTMLARAIKKNHEKLSTHSPRDRCGVT